MLLNRLFLSLALFLVVTSTASVLAAVSKLVFPGLSLGRLLRYERFFSPHQDIGEAKGTFTHSYSGFIMLDLNQYAFSNPEKVLCPGLSHVDSLGFTKVNVDDNWLKNLSLFNKYKNIKGIRFECAKITDKGIPSLLNIPSLEFISLARTKIQGKNLSVLNALPLKGLSLSKTNLSPDAFTEIAKLKSLQQLHIDNLDLEWLLSSKTVSEMDAKLLPVLSPLGKLHELRSINVAGLPVGDKSMKFLSALKKLDTFRAERTDIGFPTISLLKDMPLIFLNVANCRAINDEALIEITKHNSLTSLKISWCKNLSEKGLNSLSQLSHLQYLDMKNVPLQNSRLGFLKNLPKLKQLVLDDTGANDQACKNLAGLSALEQLQISGTNFSDKSIPVLAKLKALKELHLGDSNISEAGIGDLQKYLPQCKIILE